jgi:DNA-binding transcriptional regulator PaaX
MAQKYPYWRPFPLIFSIMNIIERREGVLLENDLIRLLESDVGEFSERELNRALMRLETKGLIHVQSIKKNQRVIKLITSKQKFLAIGED